MLRNILSVIAGLIVAMVTFVIAETINAMIHPAVKTVDFNDKAAVKTFYENQPITLWLMVLVGWFLGALLCGFLIKYLTKSNSKNLPIIAGSLLTLSAVANFFSIPHPTWFIVVGLIIFMPATLLGHNLYKLK